VRQALKILFIEGRVGHRSTNLQNSGRNDQRFLLARSIVVRSIGGLTVPNIQILASINPNRRVVRSKLPGALLSADTSQLALSGAELLLAAIGIDTSDALLTRCRAEGWNVDNVYIELGLHGTSPWQAIGQRIWVDGQLAGDQVASLLGVADHLPLLAALHPGLCLRSRVEKLRRPDLE
jgi:hypothetical protein